MKKERQRDGQRKIEREINRYISYIIMAVYLPYYTFKHGLLSVICLQHCEIKVIFLLSWI